MKINSISIVPQEVGCNASCKYCIAHLTKDIRKDMKKPGIILPKLEKCLKYAKDGGAQTAIITSSDETLLGSWTNIENILWLCSKHFGQIDLHTNGKEILLTPEYGKGFDTMIAPYLTNVTITIPHYKEEKQAHLMWHDNTYDVPDYEYMFKILKSNGIRIRLSCVVCDVGIHTMNDLVEYINWAKGHGVNEVIFRELWIPDNINELDDHGSRLALEELDKKEPERACIIRWCYINQINISDIEEVLKMIINTGNTRRKMLSLYDNNQPCDFDGIMVSWSTCTQNASYGSIKSVVYRPDNFLYSDWDTKCRIM